MNHGDNQFYLNDLTFLTVIVHITVIVSHAAATNFIFINLLYIYWLATKQKIEETSG